MLETTQKHLGHIPQWGGIIYYKRGGCTVAEWRDMNFSEPFRQGDSWRWGSGGWQVGGGTSGLEAPGNLRIFCAGARMSGEKAEG